MTRGVMTALALLTLVGCAPALAAPPRLIASWPTAGASLSVSRQILELTFNHALDANLTRAAVWRADGSAMPIDVALDPNDARLLKVHLLEPTSGNFDLLWHAVAADSHLASDGDQPFALHAEAPAPPRIDVSPGTADNNERLELVGKGFAADSPLQLTIGDQAQTLATTTTDAQGKFNVEARVPASLPYGVQPITAMDGQGRTALGSVFMRWGGWPPMVATNLGQAGPSPGEVTFALTVRNLSDYVLEHINVVLQDPDGAVLVSADPGAAHHDGALTWVIPEMDRGTSGPYRAVYRADRAVVSHAWLEFRHRRERGCTGDTCVPAFISNSVADSLPTAPVTPQD